MTEPAPQSPSRALHLSVMLGVTALALGTTWVTARTMGGSSTTAGLAALSLVIASVASLGPVVLSVKRESWGVLVFGSSIARMLLVLAVGYWIDAANQLDRGPFWMSLVLGAVLVLIAETTVAVVTLTRLERTSRSSPGTPGTERAQA